LIIPTTPLYLLQYIQPENGWINVWEAVGIHPSCKIHYLNIEYRTKSPFRQEKALHFSLKIELLPNLLLSIEFIPFMLTFRIISIFFQRERK
jgi:hypothetical protein